MSHILRDTISWVAKVTGGSPWSFTNFTAQIRLTCMITLFPFGVGYYLAAIRSGPNGATFGGYLEMFCIAGLSFVTVLSYLTFEESRRSRWYCWDRGKEIGGFSAVIDGSNMIVTSSS